MGGFVLECSRSGSAIRGIVQDEEGNPCSVQLEFTSARNVDGVCSCCSPEEMQEQWCHHAVALIWRASELNFLDSQSGFSSPEATYRVSGGTPAEIAAVLTDVSRVENMGAHASLWSPDVRIVLHLEGDRLGAQVYFDGELQCPTLFEEFQRKSSRALDNILLQVLDDEGTWDELNKVWFINSSRGVEIALGIIQEYRQVTSPARQRVRFAGELVQARLTISWQPGGAELSMTWILPDRSLAPREGQIIGTGPHWTVIEGTIYRISPTASRIATIFPHGAALVVSRQRVGPILEAITRTIPDPELVQILHPEHQPESRIATPVPVLEFERREQWNEHFASNSNLEVLAQLDFEYPTPAEEENLVYLPDREKEQEYADTLRSLGFTHDTERGRYIVAGDAALDLIARGRKLFPAGWRLSGIEEISKGIRIADLSINVAISAPESKERRRGHNLDWFDCHVTLVQNNAHVPLSTIFKSAPSGSDRWIRLDSGAFAQVPGGGLTNLKTTLGLLDSGFRLTNSIKTRLTTAQALGFSRLGDDSMTVVLDARLKTLARKLREFHAIEEVAVSPNFEGKLRGYQQEGLRWLNFLVEFELGGILADEMGLGKTVQALALLQHLIDQHGRSGPMKGPALVVAPTSVITNWLYEARRFTPRLTTVVLHGASRKAHFRELSSFDLVITSYALLRMDRAELEKHSFSCIFLDEAQNIKNPEAATTKAAKSLKAWRRFALTGTPTENRPMELWSILDFLMPGYLGSPDFFRNHIERPILEGGPGVQVARFLNARTRPFILRRLKAEVEKDLPPKVESTLHVEMASSQRELYTQILEEVRPRVFEAIEKVGVRRATVSILSALLRLRQVCNHPNSIDALRDAAGYDSGKFGLLKDLTREALDAGRKILLFGQFREMLAIISRWLEAEGVPFLYLDGTTRNRQDLVDRFNTDPSIRLFLISLKAGGTGLNLTAADTVIIYDPWWNPAVENQAVDRAHRIGQTKKVSVYRLVTENSIEQKIMDLKARKSKLVDALINENGLSTLNLSKRELEALFEPPPAD